METRSEIVIVGAGHGGAQAAINLRHSGFAGTITLVGRDRALPYERPPLSKEYLAREKVFDRILLRPAQFWSDKAIAMRLGDSVEEVDAAARAVMLASGERLQYGKLIWAGGGAPRLLTCAGANLAGVHTVRTKEDVDRLMAQLDAGARKVVVIGGGYIGLEAAAVLRKLGCDVTLLESLPRVLARVAGEALSDFFQSEHLAQGVDLRLSATVDCVEGDGAKATGVRMADGERIVCDMVIVGIGILPEIAPLRAAGAQCGNGVRVDAYCRTSLEDVYAIGDCAEHSNRYAGDAWIRLESVQNANDMAAVAAKHICGDPHAYNAVPWFWSNQYDLRLQTAGLSAGHDQAVVRGYPRTRSFSVIYLKAGRVLAIDSVNAVKDYAQGRKLVEAGACPPIDGLADPNVALKDLL